MLPNTWVPRRMKSVALGTLCVLITATASAQAPNPDGTQALQNAAAFVQQGKLTDAEREARHALADPATRAAANSVLGTIKFQQNDLDRSAVFFEEAIKLEPRLLGAHLNLANVYAAQGKSKAAAEQVRRMLTQNPKLAPVPPAALMQLALVLINKGAVAEGIDVLEQVKRAAPSYELAFNLAGAYLLHKEPARALEAYDLALTLEPAAMQALRQAAAVAESNGELERSLSYWMRARKIEPNDPEVLLGFGRVCLRMDLLEDAEPALEQAASLKPDDAAYQYTLAAAKVGKRQFEAAHQLIEPLVKKKPDDAQLQYALGAILYTQGNLPDAAAHLRESIRLHPEQLASNYYLALVDRDQGNDAEAIDTLERLLRRYPDHALSCEVLGELQTKAQKYSEAETYLRKAIQLNPSSVKANYQLGLLLARTGRKDEAEKQLALAKTLREDDKASSRLQLRLLDPGQ
jgi:tetratricopeptide (TPR) repeat protein